MKKRRRGRKLLIATAGLATVMYVACKEQQQPPGNLVAPQPIEHPPGNLPAPPPMPPDPPDAGAGGEGSGDSTDANNSNGANNPNGTSSGSAGTAATIATDPDPHKPPREMPPGNLVAPPPMEKAPQKK